MGCFPLFYPRLGQKLGVVHRRILTRAVIQAATDALAHQTGGLVTLGVSATGAAFGIVGRG